MKKNKLFLKISIFVFLTLLLNSFNACTPFGSGNTSDSLPSIDISLGSENPNRALVYSKVIVLEDLKTQSDNDDAMFEKALMDAKSSGQPTEIILQGRTYNLKCQKPAATHCFQINSTKGLRLVGVPGKTKILIDNPRVGLIHISNSNDIEMVNFSVDYITPPFTQGRVSLVNNDIFEIDIDANFPEADHPLLNDDIFGRGQQGVAFIYDPHHPVLKREIFDTNHFSIVSRPNRISGSKWRMKSNQNLQNLLAAGDYVAYGPRTSFAIHLDRVKNAYFKNVTVHTAPSGALAAQNVDGELMFDGFNVHLPPNTRRVLSSVADALHIQNSRANVTLQNSRFQAMGDDVINTYAIGAQVINIPALNQVQLRGEVLNRFQVGDFIQFVDSQRTKVQMGSQSEVQITSIQNTGTDKIVSFNKNIYNVFNGDFAFNVNLASPRLVVRNNHIQSFRGFLRVRSSQSEILNNRFEDARNAKVHISLSSTWNEGPIVGLPSHNNNFVPGGKLVILGLNYAVIDGNSADQNPALLNVDQSNQSVTPSIDVPEVVSQPEVVTSNSQLQNLYRLYNSSTQRHLISVAQSEGAYGWDGSVIKVFTSRQQNNTIPIYRCRIGNAAQHFISTNANCEGKTVEGKLGYIFSSPTTTSQQSLWRCFHQNFGHLITVDSNECSRNGYQIEGRLGYIP